MMFPLFYIFKHILLPATLPNNIPKKNLSVFMGYIFMFM